MCSLVSSSWSSLSRACCMVFFGWFLQNWYSWVPLAPWCAVSNGVGEQVSKRAIRQWPVSWVVSQIQTLLLVAGYVIWYRPSQSPLAPWWAAISGVVRIISSGEPRVFDHKLLAMPQLPLPNNQCQRSIRVCFWDSLLLLAPWRAANRKRASNSLNLRYCFKVIIGCH